MIIDSTGDSSTPEARRARSVSVIRTLLIIFFSCFLDSFIGASGFDRLLLICCLVRGKSRPSEISTRGTRVGLLAFVANLLRARCFLTSLSLLGFASFTIMGGMLLQLGRVDQRFTQLEFDQGLLALNTYNQSWVTTHAQSITILQQNWP